MNAAIVVAATLRGAAFAAASRLELVFSNDGAMGKPLALLSADTLFPQLDVVYRSPASFPDDPACCPRVHHSDFGPDVAPWRTGISAEGVAKLSAVVLSEQ